MKQEHKSEVTAVDVINTALAVLLILWTFSYARHVPAATWSAVVIGSAIAVAALIPVTRWRARRDAANLALGLLALVAPLVAGFGHGVNAAGVHMFVGSIVAVLSGLQMAVGVFHLADPPGTAA